MTQQSNRKGSALVSVVSDTAYEVERKFDASAEAVFRALTEPELIKRWWGFPTGRWVECVADVRPGGHWRNAVVEGEHEVFFHGRYVEVDRPRRLVHTEVFEDLPGGGPDVDEPSTLVTTELTEEGGVTTMRVHVECHSPEVLQGILATGMETGMQLSYDRLEDLLPGLAA
jgi:uncharacterized protein YndB with AHSA1/START domain